MDDVQSSVKWSRACPNAEIMHKNSSLISFERR